MSSEAIKKPVDQWLNDVDYTGDDGYIPSQFALEFVTFIKLVNGGKGEENKTPVLHYKMLDQIAGKKKDIANMIHRGAAKTTLMGEYLFLYIAVYGGIPGFGKIPLAIYVSDSIENGVKNMRKNLEYRWENSEFLQKYIPRTRFTDVRYEFENVDGDVLVVKGYGAKTGVRGAKEMGQRPYLAVLDDLLSDEDARSATVIASIEDTVYKAIDYALHPTRRKTIWSGTPFNAKDPLYKAIESGAWYVNVYPVCEKFPCTREEFRGSWEDRFDYDYVKSQYDKAMKSGKIDTFNQEMMLRIMSDEDRLVQDDDLVWYERKHVLENKSRYNFYITTDFATSEKTSADYSVISVWAYNNNGDWLYVDGVVKRQLMDQNIDDVFRFVSMYKPQSVGVEVTGQQGGFIQWLKGQMIERNIFFNLASDGNSSKPGIRPNTNKMVRFMTVLPLFKSKKIWFPVEMKESAQIAEALDEVRNVSVSGFKSKHDDFCFTGSTRITLGDGSNKQINEIVKGDIVMTLGVDTLTMPSESAIMTGYKEVQDYLMSDGSVLSCTDNHPVLTTRGYVAASELLYTDIIIGLEKCKLQHITLNGQERVAGTTNLQQTLKGSVDGYINGLGNKLMDHSLKDTMYIIKTTIKMTILLTTLNLSQKVTTKNTTDFKETYVAKKSTWKEYVQKLQSGIKVLKEWSGIRKMQQTILIGLERIRKESADAAVQKLCHISNQDKFSALIAVNNGIYVKLLKTIKSMSASSVAVLLDGIEKNQTAHLTVQKLQEVVPESRRKEKVYNFEVPSTHNYVANGVVAHNCDTISMLSVMNPWKPSEETSYALNIASNGSSMWVELEDEERHTNSLIF